ncbi:MAG: NUDIX domain-containing protein [Clostridia bacterium]|nr:NUDIX domain-containing protein [Clostridia bacterium]
MRELELWDVYDVAGNLISDRVSVRGKHDLKDHEYHLIVHVWIIRSDGRVILSRRQKGKTFAGAWECTGGCVRQGEDSLSAALREVREELGLELDPALGENYFRCRRNYPHGAKALCDVWVFKQDFEEDDFTLQEDEVSDVQLVSGFRLRKMMNSGEFRKRYPYLPRLLRERIMTSDLTGKYSAYTT